MSCFWNSLRRGLALFPLLWLAASSVMAYDLAASRQASLGGTMVIEASGASEVPKSRRRPASDGARRPVGTPVRASARQLPSAAQPWHFASTVPQTVDALWQRGLSHKALGRKAASSRTVKGAAAVPGGKAMDTQHSIDAALEAAGAPPPPMHMSVGKNMTVRGAVSNQVTAWRNPITEPVRVSQEVIMESKNVMGAYADINAGDDVTISAGPEYTIASEQGVEQVGLRHNEPNSLGVGFQLQWLF